MKTKNSTWKSLIELSRLVYRVIIRLGRILIIRWIIDFIISVVIGEF